MSSLLVLFSLTEQNCSLYKKPVKAAPEKRLESGDACPSTALCSARLRKKIMLRNYDLSQKE